MHGHHLSGAVAGQFLCQIMLPGSLAVWNRQVCLKSLVGVDCLFVEKKISSSFATVCHFILFHYTEFDHGSTTRPGSEVRRQLSLSNPCMERPALIGSRYGSLKTP